MAAAKLSVLVVDDSAFMRTVISKMINATDDMRVAATAINGSFALNKLESVDPDVIVLDIEMPEMNGIEFLKARKGRVADIPVVILSSIARRGARITMEALSLGASDFILKPSGTNADELHKIGNHIISTLRAYGTRYRNLGRSSTASLKQRSRPPETRRTVPEAPIVSKATSSPSIRSIRSHAGAVKAVAIGISTGGPNALRKLVQELDPSIPVPIFVVQHMPAGFTAEFSESLNRLSKLEVKEASDGDVARPGRIFVSPGDRHMRLKRRPLAVTIELSSDPPVSGHRPSVDVLFASIADAYGSGALAVIMTGMGKDGAKEIGEVKRAGGLTIGQDEASSVVYGMPRVAAEAGFLDEILPLDSIAAYINRAARD